MTVVLATLLIVIGANGDVDGIFLTPFVAYRAWSSPSRFLHDSNSPNPDIAVQVTGGIRAQHGADEHCLGDVTLVPLLYGAYLLLSREHRHLLVAENRDLLTQIMLNQV